MSELQRQMVSLAVLFPGISVSTAARILDVRPHTALSVAWSLRRMLRVDGFAGEIHPASWMVA